MMPICQSNHAFETSQRHSATGCRLIVDGYASSLMKTPALGLHSQTNCVTNLLPVVFNGHRCCQDTFTQKPLEPLLEKDWIWGLQTPFASHYPQVNLQQPCSELRNTLSKQATRFNSHTFCLNSNTVPSFHVCTVGENMPLKRLDSSIDHITTIQSFWRWDFRSAVSPSPSKSLIGLGLIMLTVLLNTMSKAIPMGRKIISKGMPCEFYRSQVLVERKGSQWSISQNDTWAWNHVKTRGVDPIVTRDPMRCYVSIFGHIKKVKISFAIVM